MPIFDRGTDDERAARRAAKEEAAAAKRAAEESAAAAEEKERRDAEEALRKHIAALPKWEYHFEAINIRSHWSSTLQNAEVRAVKARLDALGRQGWELVAYEATHTYGSVSGKATGAASIAMFKRLALPSFDRSAVPRDLVCSECGAAIDDDTDECATCGAELDSECSDCGAPVARSATSCPNCGGSFDDQPE